MLKLDKGTFVTIGRHTNLVARAANALDRNDKEAAQRLLFEALQEEPQHPVAWLMLGDLLEDEHQKRICYQNVLAIDPENERAQREMRLLHVRADRGDDAQDYHSENENLDQRHEPLTAAQSILYPERLVIGNDVFEAAGEIENPLVATQAHSAFRDIWEQDIDICPFCAQPLEEDAARCTRCGRTLIERNYRYVRPSNDLIIYVVIMLGSAQLFLIQTLVDMILGEPAAAIVWDGFLCLLMFVLVVGLWLRLFWAYIASIIIQILIMAALLYTLAYGQSPVEALMAAITSDFFGALEASAAIVFITPLLDFLVPLQLLTVVLALIYGLWRVGPDFERMKDRSVARLDRGLSDASQYFMTGKRYADQGKWASAVLHWRLAAAKDPARAYYQKVLGDAYLKLGFHDRAVDMLKSARMVTTDADLIRELDKTISIAQNAQSAAGKTVGEKFRQ